MDTYNLVMNTGLATQDEYKKKCFQLIVLCEHWRQWIWFSSSISTNIQIWQIIYIFKLLSMVTSVVAESAKFCPDVQFFPLQVKILFSTFFMPFIRAIFLFVLFFIHAIYFKTFQKEKFLLFVTFMFLSYCCFNRNIFTFKTK